MKIAYWSNAGQSGITSNLAAISVAGVIRFPYKIITLENHLSPRNLGSFYLGKTKADMVNEVGTNYYEGGGCEGLIRKICRGYYDSDILPYYMREIIHKHLYYIPQGQVIPGKLFDYEFNSCIHSVFQLIDEFAEICMIDTASNHMLSSKTVLEEADLIVVNLYQNPYILEDFFSNYSTLLSKAIILISQYSNQRLFSMKKIAKLYHFPLEKIFPIPYNEFFHAAIHQGRLVEFITSNYNCLKDNPNYFFIQSVKRATYGIMTEVWNQRKEKTEDLVSCGI